MAALDAWWAVLGWHGSLLLAALLMSFVGWIWTEDNHPRRASSESP